MKLYREWCRKPEHRKGVMLSEARIELICKGSDSGYASVYAFDEDSANEIIASRSSSGLARYQVYTDRLVMDLDNGPEQLQLVTETLSKRGLAFTVWASGSKGYHVYLPHGEALQGRNVPHSQRVWVEGLEVGADLSLYQHGRILSLPGRVHPKTGRRKELVSTHPGNILEIPLLDMPPVSFGFDATGGVSDLEAGLWSCLRAVADEPSPGNRHTRLWSTARSFADAGIRYETTLELMHKVNEAWENQKTDAEVETAVAQAFRRGPGPPSI